MPSYKRPCIPLKLYKLIQESEAYGHGGLSLQNHMVVSTYAYVAGLADVCATSCAKAVRLRESLMRNLDSTLVQDLDEHTDKIQAFFAEEKTLPVCIPTSAEHLLTDLDMFQAAGGQGRTRKKMQRSMGTAVNKVRFKAFIAAFQEVDLQATARGHATDNAHVWLTALPGGDSGLTMSNHHFSQSVQRWLGFPEPRVERSVSGQPDNLCICRKTLDRAHLTECAEGGHPTLRHNAIQLVLCNACADHDLQVKWEAPMEVNQQGGDNGRLDLIVTNSRGRRAGVDVTVTNHLNESLKGYRHCEDYGGMANRTAEARKNRLTYAAECANRGILYHGASVATDGTFGAGMKRFLLWITKNVDKESQRFFPSTPSSIRQDRETEETNFTIPTRVKYYLVKLSVRLQCMLVDQADAVAEANWAFWNGNNVERNDFAARDTGMPQGYRHEGSPATDTPPAPAPQPETASAAPNGPTGSTTTTGTTTNVVATSTARGNAVNVQINTAHATPVATVATTEAERHHPTEPDSVQTGALTHNTNTHTHTTHTNDAAPNTHTEATSPLPMGMGGPATARGGGPAEAGQLETNRQSGKMVGGGPGGGSTSQLFVDEERQHVQTAIAIDSDDTMDGILGAGPNDTARSSSATPHILAACDGDVAEKNGDE